MNKGIYVLLIILILIAIYFSMPESIIVSGSSEGFINIPKIPEVQLKVITDVKESEGPSLPSAPFYGVSEDAPRPPIDPANEVSTILRMRRLLERLEGFFLSDYKAIENKVEYLEPLTNAKALLTRLREEIHFLDANPGMSPTMTEKKIMEGEATMSFLERQSRLVVINDIDAYSGFSVTEGFTGSSTQRPSQLRAPSKVKTRAKVSDIVNFNLRAWSEMQRLSASASSDPVLNARVNAINNIRKSMQRIIDDVKLKKIAPTDIPVFKEDLEKAFPTLTDPSKPIPKLLSKSKLPPELANLIQPGKSAKSDKDINALISKYMNTILNSTSFSLNVGIDYISSNKVKLAQSQHNANSKKSNNEKIVFNPLKQGPNIKLSFTDKDGSIKNNVAISASDGELSTRHDVKKSSYNPSLDWKGRTKQICEQIRMRGLDPQDFGCLKATDEVSHDYSWRGHAKMVCSRLQATPDPALPVTCGCPPTDWSGWKSDFDIDNQSKNMRHY
jgi:hypothetical protein